MFAKEAMLHAGAHAFRDRKKKKRDFKHLWHIQINAASRQQGLSYSKFAHLMKQNKIELNRKVLSEIAQKYPEIFKEIINKIK